MHLDTSEKASLYITIMNSWSVFAGLSCAPYICLAIVSFYLKLARNNYAPKVCSDTENRSCVMCWETAAGKGCASGLVAHILTKNSPFYTIQQRSLFPPTLPLPISLLSSMSLSLLIRIQICAHHTLLWWPFIKVCALCDQFNAAWFLPVFWWLELKGDCKVLRIVRRDKGEALYIGYISLFQPSQTLKCYPCMTGSKEIVFSLGWQSERDVRVGGISSLRSFFA